MRGTRARGWGLGSLEARVLGKGSELKGQEIELLPGSMWKLLFVHRSLCVGSIVTFFQAISHWILSAIQQEELLLLFPFHR